MTSPVSSAGPWNCGSDADLPAPLRERAQLRGDPVPACAAARLSALRRRDGEGALGVRVRRAGGTVPAPAARTDAADLARDLRGEPRVPRRTAPDRRAEAGAGGAPS